MACTVEYCKTRNFVDEDTTEIRLSSLTAGLDETIDHGGPHGVAPERVEFTFVEPPTDGSVTSAVYKQAHDDTTNDHIVVNFTCPVGGSLDGAVVVVICHFRAAASGGFTVV